MELATAAQENQPCGNRGLTSGMPSRFQTPLHRQGRTHDHAVVAVLALQLAALRGVRVLVDVADPIGVFLCVVQTAGVDILLMRMRHVDFERDGDSASFFHQSTDSALLRKRQKTNFLREYTIEMLYGTNAVSESDAESGTA